MRVMSYSRREGGMSHDAAFLTASAKDVLYKLAICVNDVSNQSGERVHRQRLQQTLA